MPSVNPKLSEPSREEVWPSLPFHTWKDTYATLHMWTQIVGKVRLELAPFVNHWWNVALYVTPDGLTTSPIPYGNRSFEVAFDFINHILSIKTQEGTRRAMALAPRSVADFYHEFLDLLGSLNIQVKINPYPQEVPNPIRCDQDHQHNTYDRDSANRFWRILVQSDRLMKAFRSDFLGKCSPVHFFWGSFDLAVTRFSGRRIAKNSYPDRINREAYSHEVSSCGFWPGSGNIEGAAFYAYAAPEPPGYTVARVQPDSAFYNPPTHNFILMYEEVRKAANPDQLVLDFFRSTYAAAADLGKWDRTELERQELIKRLAS
jgi:hypothetical protein